MAYADKTTVPFERSVSQINAMLRKAGADQIAQMEDRHRFAFQFFMHERLIRFSVSFPDLNEMPEKDGRGSSPETRSE